MPTKQLISKVIAVWIVFALLHFANGWFPNPVFAFLGETEGKETVFGHNKMNFYAYLFVCIAEFFILRKHIDDVAHWTYTRLFTTILYPWLAFIFWMTGSALNGGAEMIRPLELGMAFSANLVGAYAAVRVEEVLDGAKYRNAFKWMVLLFFVISLVQYISFEMNVPWWGLFGSK